MTKGQNRILKFIVDFMQEHGFPPSVREMGAGLGGIKSSTVAYYIKALIKKGILKRGSTRARDLKLATPGPVYGTAGMGTEDCPLFNRTPNVPHDTVAISVDEVFLLDRKFGRTKGSYLLRMKDDSMISTGIFEGDLLLVRPQKVAGDGDVVVAYTPDGRSGVREFRKKEAGLFLVATNTYYPPVPMPFEIAGKVVCVIRRL